LLPPRSAKAARWRAWTALPSIFTCPGSWGSNRFSREPQFLGHHLAATGRSLEELAELLGCTLETLDHLRICFPPRAERWEADLDELAPQEVIGVSRQGLLEEHLPPTLLAAGWVRSRDARGRYFLLPAQLRATETEETKA
jgi:hypothetical protein